LAKPGKVFDLSFLLSSDERFNVLKCQELSFFPFLYMIGSSGLHSFSFFNLGKPFNHRQVDLVYGSPKKYGCTI